MTGNTARRAIEAALWAAFALLLALVTSTLAQP